MCYFLFCIIKDTILKHFCNKKKTTRPSVCCVIRWAVHPSTVCNRLSFAKDLLGRAAGYTLDRFITGLTYRDKQPFTLTPTGNLDSLRIVGGSRSAWREPMQHGENIEKKGPAPACTFLFVATLHFFKFSFILWYCCAVVLVGFRHKKTLSYG